MPKREPRANGCIGISALLTPEAFEIYQTAPSRGGGRFISTALVFYHKNGPASKDGLQRENDSLRRQVRHLGDIILKYIEARRALESELEIISLELQQAQAELARLVSGDDAETEQGSQDG